MQAWVRDLECQWQWRRMDPRPLWAEPCIAHSWRVFPVTRIGSKCDFQTNAAWTNMHANTRVRDTFIFCVFSIGGTSLGAKKFPWQWHHMAVLCCLHLPCACRIIRARSRQATLAPSLIPAQSCVRQAAQFNKGLLILTPCHSSLHPQPVLERSGKKREQLFAKYLPLCHWLEASLGISSP